MRRKKYNDLDSIAYSIYYQTFLKNGNFIASVSIDIFIINNEKYSCYYNAANKILRFVKLEQICLKQETK